MSQEVQNEITFDGLQRLLCRMGFAQPAKIRNSLSFQHPETGTLIVLSIPRDGRSVRGADLLSVLVRLESDGLVDDNTLAWLKSGRIPLAP